jgi:hypothetical protein
MATGWRSTWRASSDLSELEGRRGAGERAGSYGLADFQAGIYPACSEHGAMLCVRGAAAGESLWRCLVEGCNIGCVCPTRSIEQISKNVRSEERWG